MLRVERIGVVPEAIFRGSRIEWRTSRVVRTKVFNFRRGNKTTQRSPQNEVRRKLLPHRRNQVKQKLHDQQKRRKLTTPNHPEPDGTINWQPQTPTGQNSTGTATIPDYNPVYRGKQKQIRTGRSRSRKTDPTPDPSAAGQPVPQEYSQRNRKDHRWLLDDAQLEEQRYRRTLDHQL